MVTRPLGWVKDQVPFWLSVTEMGSPLRSVTVTESTANPSSGFGVMVTRWPQMGAAGVKATVPFFVSVTMGG